MRLRLRIGTSLILATALTVAAAPDRADADVIGYATDNRDTLFSVDLTTATATVIGATGLSLVEGLALDSSGNLYGTDGSGSLYSLSTTTGAATLIGDTGLGDIEGLAFNGGTLVATSFGSATSLYSLNLNTAAPTLIAATNPVLTVVRALTITGPTTGFVIADLQAGQALYAVDPTTGATSLGGPINPLGDLVAALGSTSGGALYALDSAGNAYTVAANGIFTLIGNTGGQFYLDLVIVPSNTSVPEPSSLVLCGLGAVVVVAAARRSRTPR